MTGPRAFIFDLDGTLIDSYPAIAASVNHIRASRGLPPLSVGEVRRHVGHGPAHLLAHTVPGSRLEIDLQLYRTHHPTVLRQGTVLLPHVEATLHVLVERGVRLSICSNKPKPFTLELLEYLEIAGLFAAVVGPEDAPRLKPAPDMLLRALEWTGVSPTETVYIGDMVVDIETARAAGVPVWSIPTGSDDIDTLHAARPDRLLTSFDEIAEASD